MAMNILETLKQLHIDLDSIADQKTRASIVLLLNIVEFLTKENQQQKEEVQLLKDEINRLKKEQGRPVIRPQKKEGDISSEKERRGSSKKPKKIRKKKEELEIHSEQLCAVDPEQLPEDAAFKGYDTVIIQDVVFRAENTAFKREVFYSASENRRIIGDLPPGHQGEFGPGIKTLVLCLYNDSGMSQPKIYQLLDTAGVYISKATLSRIITDDVSIFHPEKTEIIAAGFASSPYQHIDDTKARVNGVNHYNHILCNPLYTAYFTRPGKDRLTLLEILNQEELTFVLNAQTLEWLTDWGLSVKQQKILKPLLSDHLMKRVEMDQLLANLYPLPGKQKTNRHRILEASALTAFCQGGRPFPILVCDDAPQFRGLMENIMLCWVHEGRHYKKLSPCMTLHREQLETVRTEFWDFYHALLAYKENPSVKDAEKLSQEFDRLFSQKTGYLLLDDRLEKTLEKKVSLLLVLEYPELPLHNNPAELGARVQARRRDVNLQTKNEKGTQAKDTMMTIIQTARKLQVNIFSYVHDRLTKNFKMPSLASLILSKS